MAFFMLVDYLIANISTCMLVVLAALLIYITCNYNKTCQRPPGPKGLPFVGNLITFGREISSNRLYSYVADLHDKYGDIVSFSAGAMVFVQIKNGKLIKKLFAAKEFEERPIDELPFARKLLGGVFSGIANNNGKSAFEMRKFALTALRDFGVGAKSLDESIQVECEALCDYLSEVAEKNDGIINDLKFKSQQSAANVIHNIIFGFRYDYESEKWAELQKHLRAFFEVNFVGFPENFFPILRYVPFMNDLIGGKEMKKFYSCNDYLRKYVNSQIEEHKSTYCDGEIRDFIDFYLKYEKEEKEYYTRDNIYNTILDIFQAGSDTTAISLAWCIQYLVAHPDIQRQLRREVDEVLGDEIFDRSRRSELVKTRAFIYEVFRHASIAPSGPPRTVRSPTAVNGYIIPKNSFIFPSIYALHHDKSYWKDPENFRLDRWIGDNDELLLHEDHFLPFATGKRVCIGRQLALIEILLFVVAVLRRFKFEKVEGYEDMSNESASPILRSPKSFHLRVLRRT